MVLHWESKLLLKHDLTLLNNGLQREIPNKLLSQNLIYANSSYANTMECKLNLKEQKNTFGFMFQYIYQQSTIVWNWKQNISSLFEFEVCNVCMILQ